MRWERKRTAACETEVRSGEQLCERCTQLRCIPANSFFFYLQGGHQGSKGCPMFASAYVGRIRIFLRMLLARVFTKH